MVCKELVRNIQRVEEVKNQESKPQKRIRGELRLHSCDKWQRELKMLPPVPGVSSGKEEKREAVAEARTWVV